MTDQVNETSLYIFPADIDLHPHNLENDNRFQARDCKLFSIPLQEK